MIKINHKLKKYKNNSTKLMMRMINLLHYLSNKYKVVSLNRIIIMIIIKIRIIIIIIINYYNNNDYNINYDNNDNN